MGLMSSPWPDSRRWGPQPFPSGKRAGRNQGHLAGWGLASERRTLPSVAGSRARPASSPRAVLGQLLALTMRVRALGAGAARVAMTAAGVARAPACRPQARTASPRPTPPPRVAVRTPPTPPPAVGRGRASLLTSVWGSEDGCGAQHRAVAAAAAAGGERGGRGLLLVRGALS